jgi:hypothetical protein
MDYVTAKESAKKWEILALFQLTLKTRLTDDIVAVK